MKTIELFSGTKSFSKVAKRLGHDTFTIDNDQRLGPDLVADIRAVSIKDIPYQPDIIWASPPCTTFSVASIGHYWTDGKPKNDKCLEGIEILSKTIEFIKLTQPKYWFIENPRGMMRKVIDEVAERHNMHCSYIRNTVTYCQYGADIMKPTDIWTNCLKWEPRKMCKPGADCHQRAGRGAKTGVQGIYNPKWEKGRGNTATARGVVPPELFEDIFRDLSKQS